GPLSKKIAENHVCSRLLLVLDQHPDCIFCQKIIAVQVYDKISGGNSRAAFASRRKPSVFFFQMDDSFVLGGKTVDDVPAIIRGSVVYYNDFQIFVWLIANGLQAFGKIAGNVVHRNDNRNFWGHIFYL